MNNFDYYNFQLNSVRKKIMDEILFYEGCEYRELPTIKDYLIYLRNRIGTGQNNIMNKNNDKAKIMRDDGKGNKYEIKKMNMDEYGKDLDLLVYNKPWNKMKEFHKVKKINEFVDHLEYTKKLSHEKIDLNKKTLVKEIYDGMKNKKFGKNKSEVVYDPEKMSITSISSIWYNKKTGLYEIDWDN